MKKLFFILLLTTQVFFAQTGFEIGNDLYQKGQYQKAIAAYESVVKQNKESVELYFNLGNSYFKMHQVAPAIYNYEKALVLDPTNKEVLNNIKFAQKQTIDEIKIVPKVGFAKLLRDFTGIYPFETWAWISIGFSFLIVAFFMGYYFFQNVVFKRVFFISMFVMLLFMGLSFFAAYTEKCHFDTDKPAIVFAESAEVKSEPQNTSSATFLLHEGTKVYVMEKLGSWKKIQLTDGTEGWIQSNAIKEVK